MSSGWSARPAHGPFLLSSIEQHGPSWLNVLVLVCFCVCCFAPLSTALGRQIRFTVVAFVAGANPDEVPPVYGVVGSPTRHEGRRQYPVTYTPLVGDER